MSGFIHWAPNMGSNLQNLFAYFTVVSLTLYGQATVIFSSDLVLFHIITPFIFSSPVSDDSQKAEKN